MDSTPEQIKQEILESLPADIDKREGSFANDIVSPIAHQLWAKGQQIQGLISTIFVDETCGPYIDRACAQYGITRKPGRYARPVMKFTGKDGTAVPKGKVFLTSDGREYVMEEDVTLRGGGEGVAQAVRIGAAYNVEAGEITKQYQNISGLEAVTNLANTEGVDDESDKDLFARYSARLKKPATSGNINHYEEWALEVPGVGAARAFAIWSGPGTVQVFVTSPEHGPVSDQVLGNCTDHIEGMRPVGATVTVSNATSPSIRVAATVRAEEGTTLETIKIELGKALKQYLFGMAFKKAELVFNRVAAMLLQIPGVIDYTALTVNGDHVNIPIEAHEVPLLGDISIEAAI